MKYSWEQIHYRIGSVLEKFLRLPFIHWFNPLVTLYLNFRSFPLRQAWRLPVFVYGWPRLFSLYGRMECGGQIKMGMIKLNQTNVSSPSYTSGNTEITNNGRIFFNGSAVIYTANKIVVGRRGMLVLGDDIKIMHYCNIAAHELVRIGSHSWVVHRCQVLDSNFHFTADFANHVINKYTREVIIGDYCWICNSSTIAAGAVIPNKTIVASNSLVNKDMSDIPQESIIGGQPAKLLKTGVRRIDNKSFSDAIFRYFLSNPQEKKYPLESECLHSICDAD